uniref:Uncharacterized protein n=1 Tax=Chromera velia CCMP2878 TaxID=1169474 RepID=A0A0G4IC90_9ALVE|eukprot:Cvel_12969.t1-p1 / transcript=Cvel_12969.t1 / gene=Cvel_12969 / organism=Chromera_velia_CCMP2878 / gene_product=hypothetical protein / transcript_product=hypothetical protein / location=Cvel_scaffold868:57111-61508(+) / protein_length=1156 / sequence_SO=supercontig / SO=protein_coding / is_pseudo=false
MSAGSASTQCEFDAALSRRGAQRLPNGRSQYLLTRATKLWNRLETAVFNPILTNLPPGPPGAPKPKDYGSKQLNEKLRYLVEVKPQEGAIPCLQVKRITDPRNPVLASHLLSGARGIHYGLFLAEDAPAIASDKIQWLAHYGGSFCHDREPEEQTAWETSFTVPFLKQALSKSDQNNNWPTAVYAWDASGRNDEWFLHAGDYGTKAAFVNHYAIVKQIKNLKQMRKYKDRKPNCTFRTVYLWGWPHLFLCSLPGVAIEPGDELIADLGVAFLQGVERAVERQGRRNGVDWDNQRDLERELDRLIARADRGEDLTQGESASEDEEEEEEEEEEISEEEETDGEEVDEESEGEAVEEEEEEVEEEEEEEEERGGANLVTPKKGGKRFCKHVGVHWNRKGKWIATLTVHGKKHSETFAESEYGNDGAMQRAIAARKEMERKYRGQEDGPEEQAVEGKWGGVGEEGKNGDGPDHAAIQIDSTDEGEEGKGKALNGPTSSRSRSSSKRKDSSSSSSSAAAASSSAAPTHASNLQRKRKSQGSPDRRHQRVDEEERRRVDSERREARRLRRADRWQEVPPELLLQEFQQPSSSSASSSSNPPPAPASPRRAAIPPVSPQPSFPEALPGLSAVRDAAPEADAEPPRSPAPSVAARTAATPGQREGESGQQREGRSAAAAVVADHHEMMVISSDEDEDAAAEKPSLVRRRGGEGGGEEEEGRREMNGREESEGERKGDWKQEEGTKCSRGTGDGGGEKDDDSDVEILCIQQAQPLMRIRQPPRRRLRPSQRAPRLPSPQQGANPPADGQSSSPAAAAAEAGGVPGSGSAKPKIRLSEIGRAGEAARLDAQKRREEKRAKTTLIQVQDSKIGQLLKGSPAPSINRLSSSGSLGAAAALPSKPRRASGGPAIGLPPFREEILSSSHSASYTPSSFATPASSHPPAAAASASACAVSRSSSASCAKPHESSSSSSQRLGGQRNESNLSRGISHQHPQNHSQQQRQQHQHPRNRHPQHPEEQQQQQQHPRNHHPQHPERQQQQQPNRLPSPSQEQQERRSVQPQQRRSIPSGRRIVFAVRPQPQSLIVQNGDGDGEGSPMDIDDDREGERNETYNSQLPPLPRANAANGGVQSQRNGLPPCPLAQSLPPQSRQPPSPSDLPPPLPPPG